MASQERATTEQIDEWSTSLRNWGRWGDDDVLGTLNFVTAAARLRGVSAVKAGRCVSCSREVDVSNPIWAGLAHRFMLHTGEVLGEERRGGRLSGAGDGIYLQVHGLESTHLDALAHVSWDRKLYNGLSPEVVTTGHGATKLGIETASDGIVTRGVLLDIAAARGVEYLEPGEGVLPSDLEEAERRQGVRVESGDAVLVVTGFPAYRRAHPDWSSSDGIPGWQVASLPWLREREVALIGADSGSEVLPTGYGSELLGVLHGLAIAVMGLWVLDNCQFDDLITACAQSQQWTFLFVVAPLRVLGATGSPVNPLAVI